MGMYVGYGTPTSAALSEGNSNEGFRYRLFSWTAPGSVLEVKYSVSDEVRALPSWLQLPFVTIKEGSFAYSPE
jgi:hypothetical protein